MVATFTLDGELAVKQLINKQGQLALMAKNPLYPNIPIHDYGSGMPPN